ncbi:MAG: hypothetical protein AAB599_01985 [Patescibacteria group bacterium]
MAAAQELEVRPTPEVSAGQSADSGLIERVEVPQASQATQQVVQPTVVAQPQAVQDDKGNTILVPSGEEVVNVPYTPKQIKEIEKEPVESSCHWLVVFWKRVVKHALLFGKKVLYPSTGSGQGPGGAQ